MKKPLRRDVGRGSRWSRWLLSAAVAAGLTLGFAPAALADSPDASVTTFTNSSFGYAQMAQVYTALHTGKLYQIAFYAGTSWSYAPVTIEVHGIAGGVPASTALVSLPAQTKDSVLGGNLGWRTYPLNPGVQVTAGTSYAIVARAGTFGTLGNYLHWGYTNFSNANFTGAKMLVRSFDTATWSPIGGRTSAFDFETWVSTGPRTPTIAANASTASAPEGTAPTMTGTYTDPNGGASLQADHGKVVVGAGGSWTWTGDVYDEDTAPSSVTITLTDSAGQTASVKFALSIMRVKPQAGISAGTALAAATTTAGVSRPEGSSLTLTGTATSADPADQAAPFTYNWTVSINDGPPSAPVTGPSYSLPINDEGSYTVSLTATDDGGVTSDPVALTVTGTEVTPAVTIRSVVAADQNLTFFAPGQLLNFTGTAFDPAPETHTIRWDFGDGQSSSSLVTTHTYTAAGTYTVTLSDTDDSGVAGTATTTVQVLNTQQALASMIAYVQRIKTLNAGQQNALIVKLNAASDAAARGNNQAAHNELNAFLNLLEADLKAGKISSTDYNALRADAHAVQGAMGTFNRFLEWWPLPA